MESENEFKRILKGLDGSDGVVYLMFLGREKYTKEIQDPLIVSGFYAHKENVNQAFSRLTTEEYGDLFLRFVREESGPGKPQIYTANFKPIFITLRETDIKFDEERLKLLFTTFSFLNDDFPRYIVKRYGNIPSFHKKMRWTHTLSHYLQYLGAFYFLPYFKERELEDKDKQKVEKLYSFLAKDFNIHPNIKNRADQEIEKFLTKYPGGVDSFIKEFDNIIMEGSLKLMMGSFAKIFISKLTSIFDSILNNF